MRTNMRLKLVAALLALSSFGVISTSAAQNAAAVVEVSPKIEAAVIEEGLFPETICEAAKKRGIKCGGVPVPKVFELASNFTFSRGTSELTAEAKETLAKFGTVMRDRKDPTAKYRISGHTDSTGSDALNKKLSVDRAAAVKNFLVKGYGVSPDQIQVEGLAATRLKRPDDPESAQNRRVDFSRVMAKN
jgi:outer membrane protein OmpA-like peptidoglycan-associated protein